MTKVGFVGYYPFSKAEGLLVRNAFCRSLSLDIDTLSRHYLI